MNRITFIIMSMFLILNTVFGFNMDSSLFDQRIDTGGYKEFIIKNDTDNQIRYKIEAKPGDRIGWDMSKWIKIYPKVVSIPPLSQKTIKVYAQSPKDAKEGEYFFNFVVTPLVIPTINKTNGKIVGVSNVSFVPIIEMLGYVGEPNFKENIDLKNLKINETDNGIEILGSIENKSNYSVNLGLSFNNKDGILLNGKVLGRSKKQSLQNFKVNIENIKSKNKIKEIVIYDSLNLVDIKTVKL